MTLVDLSPGMLTMNRQLNPECRHIEGDMRTVRLDRTFDYVFVHDAIDYMTTLETCAPPSRPPTSTAGPAAPPSSLPTT